MRMQVFAVFDKAVKAYMPPFMVRSAGEALRSFSSVVNDKDHQFSKHATDYVLFHLCEFDDVAGQYTVQEPQRVISALELVEPDPFTSDKRN